MDNTSVTTMEVPGKVLLPLSLKQGSADKEMYTGKALNQSTPTFSEFFCLGACTLLAIRLSVDAINQKVILVGLVGQMRPCILDLGGLCREMQLLEH